MKPHNIEDEIVMKPHNIEAEHAILGAILVEPDELFRIEGLKPECFSISSNRQIFEAYLELSKNKSSIDIITVCDELRKKQQLDGVGGEGFIVGLASSFGATYHSQAYADIIIECWERGRYIDAAQAILKRAMDEEIPIEEVKSKTQADLVRITSGTAGKKTMFTAVEASDNFMKDLEDDKPVGLPTGYTDLDHCIGGMEPGNVYGFGGAEKMGKSTLLMDISRHVAMLPQKPVVVRFSLEMSEKLMMRRDVSAMTGISIQDIKRRNLQPHDYNALYEAVGFVRETNMIYETTRGLNPSQMESKLRHVELMYGRVDLIHVDYLQIMRSDKKHGTEAAEGEYIASRLAEIAGAFNCPLIVGAQVLSKEIGKRQDKRPQLSDVRYSSGLQANAYFVAFVHRQPYYEPDLHEPSEAQLIVRAHRDGAAPEIALHFEAECATFKNAAKVQL